MSQEKQKISGDLIDLTDIFRRGAEFDDQALAKAMVDKTTELVSRLTWSDMIPHNRKILINIKKNVQELAELAKQASIEEIILPVTARNPNGQLLRDQVLKDPTLEFAVKISLAKRQFAKDNSALGFIRTDLTAGTILDDGNYSHETSSLIGIPDITRARKDAWAGEHKEGANKQFAFMVE